MSMQVLMDSGAASTAMDGKAAALAPRSARLSDAGDVSPNETAQATAVAAPEPAVPLHPGNG